MSRALAPDLRRLGGPGHKVACLSMPIRRPPTSPRAWPRETQGELLGLRTLYQREVRRFQKVWMQTVAAPVLTTLLYMMIFVVAVRGAAPPIGGTPFNLFIAPGLIMMAVLNNAFANASSSLIQAKIMGIASDFLTPPLSPAELTAGFGLGAATRGVFVGVVTAIAVTPFVGVHIAHLWAVLFFGVGAALMMGLAGMIAGLWSEKFDHLAAVQNFIVMPLTFLSGTFYTVDRLPEPFSTLSHFNPFFYLIDGFRYGFIGQSDGSIAIGVVVTTVLTVGLSLWCWLLFRSGWRLKS
jgi:ABC-2 type transport system permease protein